jgi:hypothetical protein
VLLEITYHEAVEIVEALTAGTKNPDDDWQPSPADTLRAVAERNRVRR